MEHKQYPRVSLDSVLPRLPFYKHTLSARGSLMEETVYVIIMIDIFEWIKKIYTQTQHISFRSFLQICSHAAEDFLSGGSNVSTSWFALTSYCFHISLSGRCGVI